jgi:hypothetical protein
MRSIALAILLAGGGIEAAILEARGIERKHPEAHGVFALMVLLGLLMCLITGA